MDVARIEGWLRRRLQRDANVCLLLAPLAILGGLLVLFLTFWFSYAVILMVAEVFLAIPELLFGTQWKLRHTGRLWLSAGFLVLLCWEGWRRRGHHSGVFDEFSQDDPSSVGMSFARLGGASRASLLLLHPSTSARIIVDLLLIGPRLFFGGGRLLAESGRARAADTRAGTRVLWTLLTQPRKVAYDELQAIYPRDELIRAFHALRRIQGVVFLEQGVSLTQELRTELGTLT